MIDLDTGDGFYLAVVDFGTCMSVNHLIVLYYVCPEETSERISRPETIEYESLGDSVIKVNGECVGNSSPQFGSSPVLQCGNMGQWQVVIPCLCSPGYELQEEECSGTERTGCILISADNHTRIYLSSNILATVCVLFFVNCNLHIFLIMFVIQSVQRVPTLMISVMVHVSHVQLTVRLW